MAYRETPKTQAKRADTQQRILTAARVLLVEGGFAAITMGSVAKAAEVATGSMYRYFPNKVELCTELFRQLSGREVAQMQNIAASELNPKEQMTHCCHNFIQRAFRAPIQSYALMAEPLDPSLEAERLRYRQAYAEVYEGIINAGIAQGDFCYQDAHISSLAIVGMLAEPLLEPLSKAPSEGHQSMPSHHQLAESVSGLCLRSLGYTGALSKPLSIGETQ